MKKLLLAFALLGATLAIAAPAGADTQGSTTYGHSKHLAWAYNKASGVMTVYPNSVAIKRMSYSCSAVTPASSLADGRTHFKGTFTKTRYYTEFQVGKRLDLTTLRCTSKVLAMYSGAPH